jgi:hypothetical protein
MKILLDYFFPITTIEPTPAASTAFLKQACIVVLPRASGGSPVEDVPQLCTSNAQIALQTDNVEGQQLLAGGLSRVYTLAVDDLADLSTILAAYGSQFYTLIISSDFNDAAVTAMDIGTWDGVIGRASTDDAFLAVQAVIEKRVAFHTTSGNKAKNMCYAFGKLLSNSLNWANQQYISMPFADDIDTLGEANNLYDDKISFVLSDDEYGNRLGLFCAGGKAIVAPYIKRNLEIDLQSGALTYVSANQPAYSKVQAALLEDELQKVVNSYISRQWIESGKAEVLLEQTNFVASAYMEIAEPNALWRIFGEITQTT